MEKRMFSEKEIAKRYYEITNNINISEEDIKQFIEFFKTVYGNFDKELTKDQLDKILIQLHEDMQNDIVEPLEDYQELMRILEKEPEKIKRVKL